MIYITGDTHGDLSRLKSKELSRLKKNDTLIICGDFGFVWDGSAREKRLLKWIGKRRYHVLFVEGVHDNLELLAGYPEGMWQGGKTRELGGRLRQLCRGEVFEIEGKRIFAFGGGRPDEEKGCGESGALPSRGEIERARHNLNQAGYKVDYIITHSPSRRIRNFLMMNLNDYDILDGFLDEVREKCDYKRWFFGSIHKNKRIPPNEMALFTSVVSADGDL